MDCRQLPMSYSQLMASDARSILGKERSSLSLLRGVLLRYVLPDMGIPLSRHLLPSDTPTMSIEINSRNIQYTIAVQSPHHMIKQHEFCWTKNGRHEYHAWSTHKGTHLFGSLVEHLALRTQRVRPVYQVIQLLASLKHTLNRLVL